MVINLIEWSISLVRQQKAVQLRGPKTYQVYSSEFSSRILFQEANGQGFHVRCCRGKAAFIDAMVKIQHFKMVESTTGDFEKLPILGNIIKIGSHGTQYLYIFR